jgi:hypothetical protein
VIRAARHFVLATAFACSGALAADPESFGAKLSREHPAVCLQRLAPVIVSDIMQRDVFGWLEGIGEGRKLPPGWKRGEPHYDAALNLTWQTVLLDEQKNGPYAHIDMEERFARAFERANPAERKQIGAFLATPDGVFSWGFLVDDAMCQGLIDSMARRRVMLTEPLLQLLETLQRELRVREAINKKKVLAMSAAQGSRISVNAQLIHALFQRGDPGDPSPPNRFGVDGLVIVQRLGRDIGGALPKVVEQAEQFAAAAAR